ncbi:dephospho-CoA kinase [Mycobacterium sp.]|uniref:dephospho-CoA kinase n=1 Tax=Mycobacterium sp. TaxID=1785 RepID=UPI0031DCA13B
MLRIGLTGGIGAGKSSVTAVFKQCGGIVLDADVIAREVVEPGTAGLAALVEAFGDDILLPDGALDRPALAARAFRDDESRATLNGIVHPLVGRRRAEIIVAVPPDAVVVEDIPLLVESAMAPLFPLVVVVYADAELRVSRLVEQRGMTEADARARIAAQADDEQRRAAADVWLDNSGTPAALAEQARQVWQHRIEPFADNLAAGRTAPAPERVSPADPSWPQQATRVCNRIRTACGAKALRVDHVGPTAVPGLDAPDVIDIQVTVESLAAADDLDTALSSAGYPRVDHVTGDDARADARSTVPRYDHDDDEALWRNRIHGSADPGRPTIVHLRVDGWPNQQFGLLFVDWLVANPGVRPGGDAYRRAWEWADTVGWRP